MVAHGSVSAEAVEAARERVAASVREVDVPVWSVRVRLTRHWDASVSRPVLAQATMDVNGWSARVQVEGSTALRAVDDAAFDMNLLDHDFTSTSRLAAGSTVCCIGPAMRGSTSRRWHRAVLVRLGLIAFP